MKINSLTAAAIALCPNAYINYDIIDGVVRWWITEGDVEPFARFSELDSALKDFVIRHMRECDARRTRLEATMERVRKCEEA